MAMRLCQSLYHCFKNCTRLLNRYFHSRIASKTELEMTHKVFKFSSTDLTRFIEIYRNHECLWDPEHKYYKNRDARNTALQAFEEEFAVEGFSARDITTKIKNLRTQYHAERKKIKDSIDSGADVYRSKLVWYDLMDSFLRKVVDDKEPTNGSEEFSESDALYLVEVCDDPLETKKINRKTAQTSNKTEPSLEKRARLDKTEDDVEYFGKYVTSSLRLLRRENSVHAQNDIQAVLSKYKLKEIKEESQN